MIEANEFLNKIQLEKSPKTYQSYRDTLTYFFQYFSSVKNLADLEKLTLDDIEAYRTYLMTVKGLKFSSVNAYMRPVSVFFTYLVKRKKICNNVIDEVKDLKEPKNLPIFLTEDEANAMIASCETMQEKLMIAFMLVTGVRRDEVINIKVSDIKDQKVLVHGKGSKERTLKIVDNVYALLNEYLKTHNGEYLFTSQRGNHQITGQAVLDRVKKAARLAGFPEDRIGQITPHKLRHTTATTMLVNGASLPVIQYTLGHEDIQITMRYTHVVNKMVDDALSAQKYKV